MPEEVSNTIRNHIESIVEVSEFEEILEENSRSSSPLGHRRNRARGSFKMQENVEEKASKTVRTISKSTRIESDDYNSVNSCMQRLRESRCLSVVSEGVSFVENSFIVNELNPNNKNLSQALMQLLDNLRLNPGFHVESVISLAKELLEEVEDTLCLHLCLRLLNQMSEINDDYKLQICILGLLPLALKFVGEEYPKELRVESAYLVGQLCHSSLLIRKLFLSGGGLECIPKLIDPEDEKNKDLVLLGIDSMLVLLENHGDDFFRVWASCGVIERLVITIDNIFQAGESEVYLSKLCDLLLLFATVTKN